MSRYNHPMTCTLCNRRYQRCICRGGRSTSVTRHESSRGRSSLPARSGSGVAGPSRVNVLQNFVLSRNSAPPAVTSQVTRPLAQRHVSQEGSLLNITISSDGGSDRLSRQPILSGLLDNVRRSQQAVAAEGSLFPEDDFDRIFGMDDIPMNIRITPGENMPSQSSVRLTEINESSLSPIIGGSRMTSPIVVPRATVGYPTIGERQLEIMGPATTAPAPIFAVELGFFQKEVVESIGDISERNLARKRALVAEKENAFLEAKRRATEMQRSLLQCIDEAIRDETAIVTELESLSSINERDVRSCYTADAYRTGQRNSVTFAEELRATRRKYEDCD